MSIELAPHLTDLEMACRCRCGLMIYTHELLAAWTPLREAIGEPVTIHRGCSCVEHNARIGGSDNSEHLRGNAIDISCETFDLFSPEAFKLFLDCGWRGIGRSRRFGKCHLDARENFACWGYRGGVTIPDPDGRRMFEAWKRQRAA